MSNIRPTKKQYELLGFIEHFIAEHGYSPSYREIMNGLQYTSVATVALHVNNLIKRGHLRKRDHSARSLEVLTSADGSARAVAASDVEPEQVKWLIDLAERYLAERLQAADDALALQDGQTVMRALELLGFTQQAQKLQPHLTGVVARAE